MRMSNPGNTPASSQEPKQLLHLVFGGELTDLDSVTFRDLSKLDVVGIFPDYASAAMAWKAKAQQTVDSAQTRYFIVHLHKLLQP
ncbi:inositol monophosphatase [Methylobacterium indicum]|uniref:Inositol monophosphatase n=2 Tax=Methylobacterium indicum TaxID=1775910 RepID=A0A8H8WSW8_9HYPH|nr:inositol monophosphatase [Methylobacterium indicum]